MKRLTLLTTTVLLLASFGSAQTPPATAPPATPAAGPAATPAATLTPITDADLKAIEAPKAEVRAKGDPDGALTGTVADVAVADPITEKTPKAKGLTIADVVNQVGQNRIAINFMWTVIYGFLVMFMQGGVAIVETGLCRAKNTKHNMMMNLHVYGV